MSERQFCICCANGNDLNPLRGDLCLNCGRGFDELAKTAEQQMVTPVEQKHDPKPVQNIRDALAEAVRKARGGDAPIEVKGYA